MDRYRFVQLLGVAALVGACVLFWGSYERAICTVELGGGPESCFPDFNYLLGGIGLVVVGVVLLGYGWRKLQTGGPIS